MTNGNQKATGMPYHALSGGDALRQLSVDPENGLSLDEINQRRALYGENRIAGGEQASPLWLFLRQFTDLLIVVLLVAAIVAGMIGEPVDAIAILVIVVLNGIVGFVQEYRAERALQALQQLSAPHVQLRRGGQTVDSTEAELVPGDIVLLEAGNVVPADLRIVETANLAIDEAALTGESQPVAKQAETVLPAETVVGDRTNMVHKGTHVTSGHARCVTVATGSATELGQIAELMRARERPQTPLQRRLTVFGRRLSVAVLVICAVVFIFGLTRGEPPLLMLLTAISLAVAAIPEALPAVVTIALALGAKRMTACKALVRRLPAVETLGSVTIICCDKTGTLTQNSMRAEGFIAAGENRETLPELDDQAGVWRSLVRAMALNNDAEDDSDGHIRGDPTEIALLEAAREADPNTGDLLDNWTRVREIPFEAGRRRMTTFHDGPEGRLVIIKGAPEAVLPLCKFQQNEKSKKAIDRDALLAVANDAAQSGYRLLAFAEKPIRKLPAHGEEQGVEHDLTFLGFVALADPPRPEVHEALKTCAHAGIAVVMMTGDHPATAKAIASRLGISGDDDGVLTGAELQRLSAEKRSKAAAGTRVYARVSPEQKLDIVSALQARGHFVAMTGDGVNDAPALKRADIGIAMGLKGTDVAREAADAVLLDDNFATIVSAVREGRRIYDNIRKFIKYTMTSNAGEIWTIFLAPFLGLPLPLLPIQILWINLITDGLPGLALGIEPGERDIMDRAPRPPNEHVFSHGVWQHMIWVGLLIGGLCIGAQAWAYHNGSENWQTVVFTVLVFSQLAHALAIRSERFSLFTIGPFSNPALLGAILLSIALQFAIIYLPPFQLVFKTTGLTNDELLLVVTLPWVVFVAVEVEKWLVRRGLIYRQGDSVQGH